jgi:hypothetical protein
MASHLAEIAIRKRIAARSDAYYSDTQSLGEVAWLAFGERNKSQIRNLENIANSAMRVADILDFVKRQTGRSRPTKQWRFQDFGHNLLEKLDKPVRQDAQNIFDSVKRDVRDHQLGIDDQRQIHIFLCREFIRHLSANYLYKMGLTVKLGGLWRESQLSEEDIDAARRDALESLGNGT